jgi:hypothetical protein
MLAVAARHDAGGGPSQELDVHQAIDDLPAQVLVEPEQPRRLSNRQGQSGHFHELRTNPIGDGVYVHRSLNSFRTV